MYMVHEWHICRDVKGINGNAFTCIPGLRGLAFLTVPNDLAPEVYLFLISPLPSPSLYLLLLLISDDPLAASRLDPAPGADGRRVKVSELRIGGASARAP
jgi:hypothetical protein